VGRLVPKKGYDDLLEALRLLQQRGVEFTLNHIGSGELDDAVRRQIQALGLQSRVNLLGTLPRQEVLNYYQRSHCLVLACKVAANGDRDGIPNVLVEAMAVGLPVISTRVSAIPELVEDGVNGMLVEPANPHALANCHAYPADPGSSVDRHGPARAHSVEKRFDNRRCIVHLHDLFRQP